MTSQEKNIFPGRLFLATLLWQPPVLHSPKPLLGGCLLFFFLPNNIFYLKIFNQDPILEEAVLKYARDNLALVKVPFS